LTAYWTAPDGSTVFVDYVGLVKPISRDKISFRSNPARGEAEILSLLLLGDSDSDTSAADATSGGNERATSLGSGLAASQFNAILGQVAPGVSTKFGASDGHLSTTVAYQVNDSVTLSATYEVADSGGAVEEQGATQSGGANASERRSVSVDWRFAESWLVRGTFGVGDGATSGVDLLFHHRY
jgi:translocation and assembly module TamB